jgi:hypothetical protein
MIELLADNNFGDTRSGGLAGPTGLVIILFLIVGTVLLIRNMNARLRRLPDRFDNQPPSAPGREPAEGLPASREPAEGPAETPTDRSGADQP